MELIAARPPVDNLDRLRRVRLGQDIRRCASRTCASTGLQRRVDALGLVPPATGRGMGTAGGRSSVRFGDSRPRRRAGRPARASTERR
jgi:hypothetical protein